METNQQYEFCMIRRIDKGTSGSNWRTEYVAYQGTKILAKSKEVSLYMGLGIIFMSDGKNEERRLQNQRETEGIYQEVFQKLLNDGWEPFGTNDEGRIMTLRRQINK